RALEEGLQDNDEGVLISIFSVPKTLLSFKPKAYIPQLIALVPYHYHRLELIEMEHYKFTSVMRLQKNLKEIKFRDLVNQIAESNSCIRAYYHRFLEFDQETLSWMLCIDASFLLEYLQTYSTKMEDSLMKTAHHTVLRDIVRTYVIHVRNIYIIMLANQIPLFLLREVHSFYPREDHDEVLATMLIGFCKRLSPIKCINEQNFEEECFTKSHLLELLYNMVAPKLQLVADNSEQEKPKEDKAIGCFQSILKALCYINLAPLRLVIKIFNSKAVKLLNKSDITNLILSAKAVAEDAQSVSNEMKDERPKVEEIEIPSVTQLLKIGVKFRPSKGGLGTINFDKSSGTFYLPVIHLDGNSKVVLRNLVAYEACVAPDVMVFTHYTELMNGIIDTEEDVKILREAGIILNRLKSDEEVAMLWNGMTKSVRVTKVPILDKAIEAANACHSGCWRNKMTGFMKKYIFGSWPCLTFLAANVLILLPTLQAACSMYNCSKLFATL
ncbi:hypothetical protein ACB092_01G114400, partial [Castanea dentata]